MSWEKKERKERRPLSLNLKEIRREVGGAGGGCRVLMGGLQCENLQRGMNITLLGREANLILLRLFGWGDKTFFFLFAGRETRSTRRSSPFMSDSYAFTPL